MAVSNSEALAALGKAGLQPLADYPGYANPWPSQCTLCGAATSPTLANLLRGQGGCRRCGLASSARHRTLPAQEAQTIMRAAGLEPLVDYVNARTPWRSRCTLCDQETAPTLDAVRRKRARGCRACASASAGTRRITDGTDRAEAELRALGLEPLVPFPGVMAPWQALCTTCGHTVTPTLNSIRTGNSSGCRHCGMRAMGAAKLVRYAVRAVADLRAAGMEPLKPYPGAVKPWSARCVDCGQQAAPRLHDLRSGQPGCGSCARAAASTRRLAAGTAQALADLRSVGLIPLQPYPGARTPWSCRCTGCQRTVTPTLDNIRSGTGGCQHCARAIAGRNRIARGAVTAVVDMLDAGLEPLEAYAGSAVPWRCRCRRCGTESSPTLATIRSGSACRWCATSGFAAAAPALVYVLHHTTWQATKIGVTGLGTISDRLGTFRKHGWSVKHTVRFEYGADALATEQTVLGHLRAAGHRPFVAPHRMPHGGYTETFDAALVPVAALQDMIAAVLPAQPGAALAQGYRREAWGT